MRSLLLGIVAFVSMFLTAFVIGKKQEKQANALNKAKELIKTDEKIDEVKNEIKDADIDSLVKSNNDKLNS